LRIAQSNVEIDLPIIAVHCDGDHFAGRTPFDCQPEIATLSYGLPLDGNDEITEHPASVSAATGRSDSRLIGARAAHHIPDQRSGKPKPSGRGIRNHLDTEDRSTDPAVRDEFGHDPVDRIHRNGKTDTRVPSRRTDDGRVDPDESPGAVEQRTTRVARVDGGIGLDDIADGHSVDGIDLATESRDDPHCQGLVEAEGIADGEDALPDQKAIRNTDAQGAQTVLRRIDPEHSEVFLRRDTDQLRLPCRVIGQRDFDPAAGSNPTADDVEVRHHVTVVVPDEPRPGSLRDLHDVELKKIAAQGDGGDVHHRWSRLFEERRDRPLGGGQLGSCNRWSRLCLGARLPRIGQGGESDSPQQSNNKNQNQKGS